MHLDLSFADRPGDFLWIGPVVGMVVGVILGVTVPHWEFRGRTRRVTLGIFAGYIIGFFAGAVIAGKWPPADEEELDLQAKCIQLGLHEDKCIRLGSIVGALLGGIIGARWKSRRDSAPL